MNKNVQEGELEVRVFGKNKLNREELEKAEYALEELSNLYFSEISEELLNLEPSLKVKTRDIYINKFKKFPDDIHYIVDDRATNSKGEFLVNVSTMIYVQKKDRDYDLKLTEKF